MSSLLRTSAMRRSRCEMLSKHAAKSASRYSSSSRPFSYSSSPPSSSSSFNSSSFSYRSSRCSSPSLSSSGFCSLFSSSSFSFSSSRPFSTIVDSSFLTGSNRVFVDEMYVSWKNDPSSVHKSWDVYFRTGQYSAPPLLESEYSTLERRPASPASASASASVSPSTHIPVDSAKVVQLVRAFQVRGHLLAKLDPLGILPPRSDHEDLSISTYGFNESDMDRNVDLSGLADQVRGFLDRGRGQITLREIYTRLQETYCGTIGYEYMHIPSVEKCNWIREKIETREKLVFTREAKLQVLDRLTWADHFEQFLAQKYTTAKRFGLEGAESFVAGMKSLIGRSAELGVENVVIGMPHRGRLNVLNTVVRKNMSQIFAEFDDTSEDDPDAGHGDVKYHLGMSFDRKAGKSNKVIHLSLLANPSHLEAVDPVVMGKTKAKQFYLGDNSKARCMGLLLHGDAAFAGQGVVYETFGLSELPEYGTGGTIHIVVNNQIGFTTDPAQSRSSTYCTDIAKAFNSPVFHVNGDDPEAVVHVCELAAEWRAKFHTDVVIDLVCYRRHGHNEIDEPMFTQPLMYQKIKKHPPTLQLYQKRLLAEGITDGEIKSISDNALTFLNKAYQERNNLKHHTHDWLSHNWSGLKSPKEYSPPQPTGVDLTQIKTIGIKASTYPTDFSMNARLKGIFKKRVESIEQGKDIDWGTGEALAFGSILMEQKHVRLSGQDVERGTFSHRHAVLHDQTNNNRYIPLNNIAPGHQAHFTVTNSHLSEFAVLGFELGYSLENPHALVLWEAQFGDFFNTAQVIVDQFISSGEDKWKRQCGLVMLLPHGYEGAGPEHSSARMERFLQMSSDNPDHIPDPNQSRQIQQSNWQCVNLTTPANYYHALRRQLHREFRKPLIVFSPKSLLRADFAKSTIEEFGPGTQFQHVYGDELQLSAAGQKKVKRVVYCSGKVYYDLAKIRAAKKITNLALIRVEQLSPFPFHRVAEEAAKYPQAEVCWAQEEPMNMGAYTFVKDRIVATYRQLVGQTEFHSPRYIGRPPSASTSEGHKSSHDKTTNILMNEVVSGL